MIFNNYVNDLYNLRLTYDKSHPMNYIAKLLMNSLYGRFGLNVLLSEFTIINKTELDRFVDYNEILELIDLDDKFLMGFIANDKLDGSLISNLVNDVKSNIAISSAITAYSRMVLADIKKYCLDNGIKLFYFYTDSVFTSKPLPDHFISRAIEKWKLEAFCKEAITSNDDLKFNVAIASILLIFTRALPDSNWDNPN